MTTRDAKYLEDGCKWCGSQEWNDDLTDVDHNEGCPAPLLKRLARWRPSGLFGEIEDEVAGIRRDAIAIVGTQTR